MSNFKQVQLAFSRHIRDPQKYPKPADIEERRMAVYRDLFFNNVKGFVDNAFPVLKSFYTEQQWERRVRAFFATHQCHSPHFVDIASEFVEYLSEQYQPVADDPDFMLELAHYEWIELDVSIRRYQLDQQERYFVSAEKIALSPLVALLQYQYPVHKAAPGVELDDATPTLLAVYRDWDDEVKFTLLSPMSMLLLACLQQSPGVSVSQLVKMVEQQTGMTNLDSQIEQTLSEFQKLPLVITQAPL